MEAQSKTVSDWFTMINGAALTLPRFQRDEVWRPEQIKAVLENILREQPLPIGALLVLDVGDEEQFPSRTISGAPVAQGRPQMQLLDGQQRITAIWRSLKDNYEDFRMFVSLKNLEQPEVNIVARPLEGDSGSASAWSAVPKLCLERSLAPVNILAPGPDGEQAMRTWTRQACDSSELSNTQDRVWKLRERVGKYPISFLSLPSSTSPSTAIDVFVNMNISAQPLGDFDIAVAQVERKTRKSLHRMVSKLGKQNPTALEYEKIDRTVLATGALLCGKPPNRKTYHSDDLGEMLPKLWKRIAFGIERATEFLHNEMIFNADLLPSEVILHLSASILADFEDDSLHLDERVFSLLRKAIWKIGFADRYLKAPSEILPVKTAISNIVNDPNSKDLPNLFDEGHPPDRDSLFRGVWPARKDRLGRAIMVTSLFGGGLDLADGVKINSSNARSRKCRHIFPRHLIQVEDGIHESWPDSALNCWFISGTDRRMAQTIEQHIEHLMDEADQDELEVQNRLESHMVPYEELVSGDFSEFLKARAKRIHDAMIRLTVDGKHPSQDYSRVQSISEENQA